MDLKKFFQDNGLQQKLERLNHNNLNALNAPDRNKNRLSGTTIVALKFDGGVVIAGDRRCTTDCSIFSDDMIKVHDLGCLSALGGAGWVSDFQLLIDTMRDDIIPFWERYFDVDIFIDGQANLLKELMRSYPFMTWPTLAGWDPEMESGRIFLFEPAGTIFEMENYSACGSGENGARGPLKDYWFKNCPQNFAVKLAIQSLNKAAMENQHTSDPSISPSTVKIITSESITELKPETALVLARKDHNEYLLRNGKEKLAIPLTQKRKKAAKKLEEKKNDNPNP